MQSTAGAKLNYCSILLTSGLLFLLHPPFSSLSSPIGAWTMVDTAAGPQTRPSPSLKVNCGRWMNQRVTKSHHYVCKVLSIPSKWNQKASFIPPCVTVSFSFIVFLLWSLVITSCFQAWPAPSTSWRTCCSQWKPSSRRLRCKGNIKTTTKSLSSQNGRRGWTTNIHSNHQPLIHIKEFWSPLPCLFFQFSSHFPTHR